MKNSYLSMSLLFMLGISLIIPQYSVSIAFLKPVESTDYKIVCTNSLLADFVSNIIGEKIDSIIPPGVCPAHFDPSTTEVASLAAADLVICQGFEDWLDALLTGADNTDAKRTINPLVGRATWNVPTNAINLYIPALTTILSEQYPSDAAFFELNAANYSCQIQTAMDQIQSQFNASSNAKANVAVMSHQEYFAKWLNLNVIVVWNASDEAMSAADVAAVVEIAQMSNVSIVLSNKPSGTDVGADIATEINAKHVILANFPGDENTTDYLGMITQNVNRIKDATETEKNSIGVNLTEIYLFSLVFGLIILSLHVIRKNRAC